MVMQHGEVLLCYVMKLLLLCMGKISEASVSNPDISDTFWGLNANLLQSSRSMAANSSTMAGSQSSAQETENPGIFTSANVATSARSVTPCSGNVTRFNEILGSNAVRLPNESDLGANGQTARKTDEKPSTNIASAKEVGGAVGVVSNNPSGEMQDEATDMVDGVPGHKDDNKGTMGNNWETIKNWACVMSCIDVLGKEKVRQAFELKILGNISEKTTGDEIAEQILLMLEDNPKSSQWQNAIPDVKVHDKGHPKDGTMHVLEVEYQCKECSNDGRKPQLMLK